MTYLVARIDILQYHILHYIGTLLIVGGKL